MQAIHINLDGCFLLWIFSFPTSLSFHSREKQLYFIPFPCRISSTSLENTNRKKSGESSFVMMKWCSNVAISSLFPFIICLFRKFAQTISSGEIMFSSFVYSQAGGIMKKRWSEERKNRMNEGVFTALRETRVKKCGRDFWATAEALLSIKEWEEKNVEKLRNIQDFMQITKATFLRSLIILKTFGRRKSMEIRW